jgi:hypothetical protein
MDHMSPWRSAVLASICLGFLACEERSDPVALREPPGAQFLISPDDGSGGGSNPEATLEVPSYSSEADIPPEYASALVIPHQNHVQFYGANIEGLADMDYFGNRGRIALDLRVLHDYSTVATNHVEKGE